MTLTGTHVYVKLVGKVVPLRPHRTRYYTVPHDSVLSTERCALEHENCFVQIALVEALGKYGGPEEVFASRVTGRLWQTLASRRGFWTPGIGPLGTGARPPFGTKAGWILSA